MRTTQLRDAAGVGALVDRLEHALVDRLGDSGRVAIVGVRRGGVALAGRLVTRLRARGVEVDTGTVDISLYRDDAHLAWPRPETGPTDIAFDIDGRQVVVVDDVFWTGRTARAAMDAVLDFGRPARLWLAALVSRTGRELPIVPDAVVFEVDASPRARVELRLTEDGHPADELVLLERDA